MVKPHSFWRRSPWYPRYPTTVSMCFPVSGATSIIIERISRWLVESTMVLPKEIPHFLGGYPKWMVSFSKHPSIFVNLKTFERPVTVIPWRGSDLSWPHQVKWVVSEQQKLLKLGYYMDKLRFFVWIILNYWIMIIDHLPIFAWWQNVTPKVFSPSFRWEIHVPCLSRRELLRSQMRAEARSIFSMWANQLTLVICSWCRDIQGMLPSGKLT